MREYKHTARPKQSGAMVSEAALHADGDSRGGLIKAVAQALCSCLPLGLDPQLIFNLALIYLFVYFIYIPSHSQSSLGSLQKLKTIDIKTNI